MNSLTNPESDATEPKPADIKLSAPPVDPLRQFQSNQDAPKPAEKFSTVKQYTRSQLQKKHNRRSKRLFIFVAIMALMGVVAATALFGSSLYQKVAPNPDKHFEAMLPKLFSAKSELYSVESSAEFGIVSAQITRNSSEFFSPKTSAKIKLDLVSSGVVIDASIESYSFDQKETIQNITELSVFEDSVLVPESSTQLVKQKWVAVPKDINYEHEGLTVSFLDLASGFNDVKRTLPIGYFNMDKRVEYAEKLQELQPYDYTCEFTNNKEMSKCEVAINTQPLDEFYDFLAKENNHTHSALQPKYIERFTLFIDTETDLPIEIVAKEGDSSYRMVMDFNEETTDFIAPVGPISIETYRLYARQFEAAL